MKFDLYLVQKMLNFLDKYKKFRTRLPNPKPTWAQFIGNQLKVAFTLTNKLQMYLYADSTLSKLIYDDFEADEEAFISNYLSAGDTFLDIGANVGLHTINAAAILKNSGYIYAFEPTPATFKRLKENIDLNNLGDNVKALQIGLSDATTTLVLNVSENDNDAYNSFANLKYVGSTTQQQVPVFTAWDIFKTEQIAIDNLRLIKIDVEGWEINVLKGFGDLFDNPDFDPCFLIEFTEENIFRAGYSCRELYKLLESKGYKWGSYDSEKNTVYPSELKAYYTYENLIAAKSLDKVNIRLHKQVN